MYCVRWRCGAAQDVVDLIENCFWIVSVYLVVSVVCVLSLNELYLVPCVFCLGLVCVPDPLLWVAEGPELPGWVEEMRGNVADIWPLQLSLLKHSHIYIMIDLGLHSFSQLNLQFKGQQLDFIRCLVARRKQKLTQSGKFMKIQDWKLLETDLVAIFFGFVKKTVVCF